MFVIDFPFSIFLLFLFVIFFMFDVWYLA